MSPILPKSTSQISRPKGSDIPVVDLHYRDLESARNLVIETIQVYHTTEIFCIRFITGRGNHINSNGKRGILYDNFPKWMSDISIKHLVLSFERGNGFYIVVLTSVRNDTVPTVDTENHNIQSARKLIIKTIQEFHSKEKFVIKYITRKSKKSILYDNFPKLISDVTINHLIKFYVRHDGYYYVYLKTSHQLTKEITDTFFDVNIIRQVALEGDAEAQLILGLMYLDGEGVMKDLREALKWLTKSAEGGIIDAQLLVGHLYSNGIGIDVKKKDINAFNWFIKAAEQGDVNAQITVGRLLYDGKGVAKNNEEAFKWFSKAAEQNDVSAQLIISRLYFNGKGVAKNDEEAFKWFSKAAKQNKVIVF